MQQTKHYPFQGAVDSAPAAKKFLRWATNVVGVDLHPDTNFKDYQEKGKYLFTPKEADHYNQLMADCSVWLADPCEFLLTLPPFNN